MGDGSAARRIGFFGLVAALSAAVLPLGGCSADPAAGSRDAVAAVWGEPQNPLVPGDTSDSNGIKAVTSFLTGLISYDPRTSARSTRTPPRSPPPTSSTSRSP